MITIGNVVKLLVKLTKHQPFYSTMTLVSNENRLKRKRVGLPVLADRTRRSKEDIDRLIDPHVNGVTQCLFAGARVVSCYHTIIISSTRSNVITYTQLCHQSNNCTQKDSYNKLLDQFYERYNFLSLSNIAERESAIDLLLFMMPDVMYRIRLIHRGL